MSEMKRAEKNPWGLPDIGIPAEVLFHPKLTPNEKILYGFIRNLSKSEKGCWASNKWLGGCLGIKGDTASRAVANLKQWEIINIEYSRTPDGREVRQIFINLDYPKIFYEQILTEKGYGKKIPGEEKINRGVVEKSYPPIIKILPPWEKKPTKGDIKRDNKKDKEEMIPSPPPLILNDKITPSLFDSFWVLYPKKTDKGKATTSWKKICNKLVKDRPSWKEIETAIIKQNQTNRWKRGFIPYPATWLNQQRWLDDPAEMNEEDWEINPRDVEKKPILKPLTYSPKKIIHRYFKNKDLSDIFYRDCYFLAEGAVTMGNGVSVDKDKLAKKLIDLHEHIQQEQHKNFTQYLKDRNLLPGPITVVQAYIQWVDDNDWITNRTIDLFHAEHSLFKRFRRDEASKDNLERDPLTGISYLRD